jgi:uncharacterized protein YegL
MTRPTILLPFLLTVLSVPLSAQGLLVGPVPTDPLTAPHRPPTTGHGVHVVRTAVDAEIVDGVATTTIDQTFRNATGAAAEGTWFLPLPAGAVADGFTMTVGGKEVAGEVLDAAQARSVYESIVRQRRDPGLLEYAGEGLLRARIYPIPAHGEVGVRVRLRQVLQPTGDLYEWRWPVRAAGLGDAGNAGLVLTARIRSKAAIRTVLVPYANACVRQHGDHEATVSFEAKAGAVDDLRVLYGLATQEFGLHLMTWRQAGDPGYFALLVSPPRRPLVGVSPPRRCVQFVVDTSGSMAGDKIEQAKAALRTFLRRLRPADLFQVVTFASGVHTFFEAPQPATEANVAEALRRVDGLAAAGGTNIAEALERALSAPLPLATGSGWLAQVVFVTDGQPTVGITDPGQILERTRRADTREMRVFALGVGDEIDVRLIDDLVLQHRGARDFVRNRESIEVKVDALCSKLAEPALTDVEVRCDGLDAFDVHPGRTRDLFCGEQLQVVGRYRDAGRRTVRVRGKQDGREREFCYEVEFPALAEQHPFVPTVWARHHVASLLDAIRRGGAKHELVDEVRRLATRHGIVTPYTSQLIVEEEQRLAGAWQGSERAAMPPSGPTAGAAALVRLGQSRTGAEAVRESLATAGDDAFVGAVRRGEKAEDGRGDAAAPRLVRAGGRVFVTVGDTLVEQGLPTGWRQDAVVVEAFSAAWFALSRRDERLRAVLALGERLAFRDGERVVHVQPAAPGSTPVPATK